MHLSKKWIVRIGLMVALFVIGGGIVGYFVQRGNKGPTYETEVITRGEVVQKVRVTGQVEPLKLYMLRFLQQGTLKEVRVEVGDLVEKGDVLAVLDTEDVALRVKNAEAQLAYARAQLERVRAGATREEITLSEKNVSTAVQEETLARLQLANTEKLRVEAEKGAQLVLERARASVQSLKEEEKELEDRLSETEKDTLLRVQLAQNELKDLQSQLGISKQSTDQGVEHALKNIQLTLDGSYVLMKNGLDTMDTLLGYTDRTTDDDFEGVLGVLSPQSKNTAKSAFLAAYEAHTALEKNHITLPLEVRSIEEVKLLIAPMNTALSLNKTALLAQRTVLEKSITSNLFTQDDLESYRKEVSAHIVEMDTRLSALSNAYQSYADLLLTDTSQGATSTTELGQKENAVQIAEQALENTRASAREERTKLSTRIKDAEEEVKKAEQQLMNEQVTWKAKVKEAEEAVRASEGVVKVRRAELAKVSAVPRSVDLAPYEAEVQKAEVEKATQEKALRDMTLLAPEKGYITKIEKEIGEKLSPEENYMVMQTLDQAVVVQVSETDIAKISLDAVVNMTFDAFSYTETFTGKVTKIDPAETVIDGVTYYKVTVTLDVVNAAIKSGMTANMEIVTAQKKDVLLVPALSVKYDKDVRYVEILSNDIPERRTVTLGIEGDRYAEILSGLQEGDRVITYVKK